MKREFDLELLRALNEVLRHKGQPEVPWLDEAVLLRRELKLDSLDLAELSVRIEERFGVDVFTDGVVHSWGEIRERVGRHVASRNV